MKRFFRGGLISLFILLFLFGSITIQTVIQTQTNGRLINYVGIVRGASQRLIKLELSGQPGDDMIAYLDSILLELQGIAGEHRTSILPDGRGNLLSAVGNAYKAGKHFADNGS